MARIAGVVIPGEKRAVIALTAISGIGKSAAQKILRQVKVSEDKKVKDLTEGEVEMIRAVVEKSWVVEGDLRLSVMTNIRRVKEISCYRGSRHAKGLPARGQRTKTNARTKRGRKVTVGSGRKKSADKT